MTSFLRKGYREHQRHADLRRRSAAAGRFLARVFGSQDENVRRLLMAPLIEVAWADGRVTARESDVLLEIAEEYGLTGFEDSYCEVLDSLITRVTATESTRNWFKLGRILAKLPPAIYEKVADALTAQARFVAEQGSNNLIAIVRGDAVGRDEEAVLRRLATELKAIGTEVAENVFLDEQTTAPAVRLSIEWSDFGSVPVHASHLKIEEKAAVAVG